VEIYEGVGNYFRICYDVGDGSKVSCDVWCRDQPLKVSYLELFSYARSKDVWVADHMQFRDGKIQWNTSFTRPVQDRKVDVVFSLFEMLYFLRVRQGDVDKICWSPSKRWKFEGKSYYHVLTIPTGSPFPKSIWRVKTPSRITYFVWMATLGKILTLDYLRKRTFMVVE
jgi:hypothetical protein